RVCLRPNKIGTRGGPNPREPAVPAFRPQLDSHPPDVPSMNIRRPPLPGSRKGCSKGDRCSFWALLPELLYFHRLHRTLINGSLAEFVGKRAVEKDASWKSPRAGFSHYA